MAFLSDKSRRATVTVCVIATLLAGLQGCGNTHATDLYLKWMSQLYKGDKKTYERKDVLKIPYASIGLSVGKAPSKLIVLGYNEGDRLRWVTADPAVVVTRRGRIVETSGFEHDLKHTQFIHADPLADPTQWNIRARKIVRTVDLPDYGAYGQPVTCHWLRVGAERISIIGDDHDVVVYKEECESDELDWTFTNMFWADPESGRIWRSSQHVHPKLPPFVIEVLRPFHSA